MEGVSIACITWFTLVIKGCPIRERSPCWFMAEFCILRPYRVKGYGRVAVQQILQRHPGAWEIAWLQDNAPAAAFWPRVIPGGEGLRQVAFDGAAWEFWSFGV